MKQEVNATGLETFEIAADENIVCHLLRQVLQVFPLVAGRQDLLVVDWSIGATEEAVVEQSLRIDPGVPLPKLRDVTLVMGAD